MNLALSMGVNIGSYGYQNGRGNLLQQLNYSNVHGAGSNAEGSRVEEIRRRRHERAEEEEDQEDEENDEVNELLQDGDEDDCEDEEEEYDT